MNDDMALVSTETKGHRRCAGDANRRAMEQKRSVRRAKGEHSAEGLKSAHRRAKPHLIGKLFNEDILSPQNGDFEEV